MESFSNSEREFPTTDLISNVGKIQIIYDNYYLLQKSKVFFSSFHLYLNESVISNLRIIIGNLIVYKRSNINFRYSQKVLNNEIDFR